MVPKMQLQSDVCKAMADRLEATSTQTLTELDNEQHSTNFQKCRLIRAYPFDKGLILNHVAHGVHACEACEACRDSMSRKTGL